MNGTGHSGEEPVLLPITGELDLHPFHPREMSELIPAYLEECRRLDLLEVRLVHGKGIGNLRRTVHAILSKMPEVESFALARPEFGGWGATIVHLKPRE